MRNYIQPGNIIDVVTPEGGYVAGRGYVLTTLFGVAAATTAEGETNSLHTTGVYSLLMGGNREAVIGDAAYFRPATDDVAPEPEVGSYKIGIIVGIDFEVFPYTHQVRLNGTDVVAVTE